MIRKSFEERRRLEAQSPDALAARQLAKLNELLREILPHNRLYARKLDGLDLPIKSLDEFAAFPFTAKDELVGGDGAPANLTWPEEMYVRYHRTSGTRGRPMVVLDSADDWQWWIDAWQYVLDAAALTPADRVFLAFSFGPFIGFWSACDAALARGCMVIPGGGLSTTARLEMLRTSRATALFCTPSYALHLAEAARENQVEAASLGVRKIVVAGEPGGSTPAVRERMENAFGAAVIDHAGASEVGPWGYGLPGGEGLFVNEADFVAEFLSVESGEAAGEGELAELVLTTLGRTGCPVIRYRTGDLVKPTFNAEGPCNFVLLPGGVLGRSDDMMIIRGVNVFPSSIDQIMRSFPEVVEYRMTASRVMEMDALEIEVEDRLDQPRRIAEELQLRLGLRIEVTSAAAGSLPRFEGKGKRFIDKRSP